MVCEMLGAGSGLDNGAADELLHQMMKDQYGNYVVQKTLEVRMRRPAHQPFSASSGRFLCLQFGGYSGYAFRCMPGALLSASCFAACCPHHASRPSLQPPSRISTCVVEPSLHPFA
jgi:hypothetical protein